MACDEVYAAYAIEDTRHARENLDQRVESNRDARQRCCPCQNPWTGASLLCDLESFANDVLKSSIAVGTGNDTRGQLRKRHVVMSSLLRAEKETYRRRKFWAFMISFCTPPAGGQRSS
jgi:hypothetical protein